MSYSHLRITILLAAAAAAWAPGLGSSRRFTEATSSDLLSFTDADCAWIARAFTIPIPIGAVRALELALQRLRGLVLLRD
jgi:hypothetical protein